MLWAALAATHPEVAAAEAAPGQPTPTPQELHCGRCGKAIAGAYLTALGRAWHPSCFRCAACDQMFDKSAFSQRLGEPYHQACYHEKFSPRCAACGQPITGASLSGLGQTWHVEHFVCAYCHKPLHEERFYERHGEAYCVDDYHLLFSPRCAVCELPIRSAYLSNRSWGYPFHEQHKQEFPECYSCGRLMCETLTGGGFRYSDGRTMCKLCWWSTVEVSAEAQLVLNKVRERLTELGFDLQPGSIPVRLTEAEELKRLAPQLQALRPEGLTCTRIWTLNGQVTRREVQEILALDALPREHLAVVLAHELGHVWLFQHEFPALPRDVEEGLCELASQLWLQQQRSPEAAHRRRLLEENKEPIYGAGFQAARRGLAEAGSLAALLAYVRQHRQFPGQPAPTP